MLLILGIITIIYTTIQILVYRDIRIPPVLLGIEFSILYFLENAIGYDIYSEDMLYAFFLIGVIAFSIGFYVFRNIRIVCFKYKPLVRKEFVFNYKLINFMISLADIYFVFECIKMYQFVQVNYVENYFTTLHRLYNYTELFGRFNIYCISLSIVCAVIFFIIEKNKIAGFTFLHSSFITLAYALMTTGRAQVLFPLIGYFVIWMYSENKINYKKIIALLFGASVLFLFFLYTSSLKYSEISDNSFFFLDQIKVYLCSSMPAFIHWVKSSPELLMGRNTFRFFFIILGANREAFSIAQEFIETEEFLTNIYTLYQYYASDYGLIYSLIIQYLIGGLYSYLYKYGRYYLKKSRKFIIVFGLYALLFYPLAMQYAGDFYSALLSTWIQIIFWLWFFTRKCFMKEKCYG